MNRREFLKQAGTLLAGGVAAVSGVLAIVPMKIATPAPVSSPEEAMPFGRGVMDGIAAGIRTWDDDFNVAVEDYTPIYCPDPDNYGGYMIIGEVRGGGFDVQG